ncbi:MAG: tetratricopeptide repeat protein, partial [Planctomycetota bacterium]|nr:tetratricopeptide repeat protein [Planctomycetota bacterium]
DGGALRILGNAQPPTTEVRLAIAAIHERLRSPDLAIATLEEARRQDPDSVAVRRELARLFVRRGRWAAARSVLVEATTLDPEAADLWEGRITAHVALDQGREALDAYRALEALRPLDHDQAIEAAQLALTLPASAPLSQVAGWLSRVNQTDPSRGEAWALMGELQARMGNGDAQLSALQAGLEADPGNLVLLHELVELRGARADWDGLEVLRRHAGLLGRVELVARIDVLLAAKPVEVEVEEADDASAQAAADGDGLTPR